MTQFQVLYYPCIKYYCIFKRESFDLLRNSFACDSLGDEYNKTYTSIEEKASDIQIIVKRDGKQTTFSEGIFTYISMTYLQLAQRRRS